MRRLGFLVSLSSSSSDDDYVNADDYVHQTATRNRHKQNKSAAFNPYVNVTDISRYHTHGDV